MSKRNRDSLKPVMLALEKKPVKKMPLGLMLLSGGFDTAFLKKKLAKKPGKKMPLGLVLLSGGFDSAVAAWMVQQTGAQLLAVHFSQEQFVGKQAIEKTKRLAGHLKIKKLFVIEISDLLKQFVENADNKYYFVFMKRLFFRLAEQVAKQEKIDFLVTGENLGQVSSQTLSNVATIARSTRLPVARPLLGLEKNEIIALAKKIGTHDISVGPELCDFLGPAKPATRSTAEQLQMEEEKLSLEQLLQETREKMRLIEIK